MPDIMAPLAGDAAVSDNELEEGEYISDAEVDEQLLVPENKNAEEQERMEEVSF
jgi:hypothetical protein